MAKWNGYRWVSTSESNKRLYFLESGTCWLRADEFDAVAQAYMVELLAGIRAECAGEGLDVENPAVVSLMMGRLGEQMREWMTRVTTEPVAG